MKNISFEGGMSINQAAIHHNLPYSSLYGRINRLKRGEEEENMTEEIEPVSSGKKKQYYIYIYIYIYIKFDVCCVCFARLLNYYVL